MLRGYRKPINNTHVFYTVTPKAMATPKATPTNHDDDDPSHVMKEKETYHDTDSVKEPDESYDWPTASDVEHEDEWSYVERPFFKDEF